MTAPGSNPRISRVKTSSALGIVPGTPDMQGGVLDHLAMETTDTNMYIHYVQWKRRRDGQINGNFRTRILLCAIIPNFNNNMH